MRDTIVRNLEKRFKAFSDLIAAFDSADLVAKLNVPKNKSVAEHLWCVVGARESHAMALAAGERLGFACSMSSYAPTGRD